MAGIFPMLLVPADLALFLSGFVHWGPTVIAIVVALLVAAVLGSKRLSLSPAMTIGVVFEIAGSYGIAVAEYTDPLVDSMPRGCWGSRGSPCGRCCSRSSCPRGRAGRSWPPWHRSARCPSSSVS